MPDDPNNPRYFHALCCGAHVRKAVRGVALASLICSIIQTVWIVILDEWEFFNTAVIIMDFCATFALVVAIHKRSAFLVIPYLVIELLYILAFTIEFIIGRQDTSEDPDYQTAIKIAHWAGAAVGIVVNIYFLKVAFNFLFYLLNRTDETEEPYSIHCDVKSNVTGITNLDLNPISIVP